MSIDRQQGEFSISGDDRRRHNRAPGSATVAPAEHQESLGSGERRGHTRGHDPGTAPAGLGQVPPELPDMPGAGLRGALQEPGTQIPRGAAAETQGHLKIQLALPLPCLVSPSSRGLQFSYDTTATCDDP
jgi:hypothetical protein